MNNNKYGIFLIVFGVVVAICLIACARTSNTEQKTHQEDKFGKGNNNLRTQKNIPIIEEDWVITETAPRFILWSNTENKVITPDPTHLLKYVFISDDNIWYEEDDFHFEGDANIAYRLVSIKSYNQDTTSFRFIKYVKDEFPGTEGKMVTEDFADSVLTAWKLK